jgi:uncharacterized LabA/DUF88 family protein
MRILDNSFVFFVDADNLFFGARNNRQAPHENARIDFKALKDVALDGRSFAFSSFKVFASMRSGNPDYFAHMLKKTGYFSHIELRPQSPHASVRDMDVIIAVEAVTYKIDGYLPQVVSIASGDADFIPAYKYLKAQGVRVEAVSFPECIAREVADTVDRFIVLDTRVIFNELAEPQKVSV